MATRKQASVKRASNVQLIRTCSIWRALEIIGDTPTLLITQSYWLGARRFDDFCQQTGLLKTVVSDRLKRLIDNDCLVKIAYSERPKRYEYKATQQFLDFFPTALAMLWWERKWGARDGKIDIRLTHTACGQVTEPRPVCKSCGEEIDPRDVSWKPGPGVGLMPATYSRRRRQTSPAARETALPDAIVRIIGDRWATLILRSIFTGINQFQEIVEDTAISTNILADRLADLAEQDIITGIEDPNDMRRTNYKLTEKGRSVYPVLLTLLEWGDKWRPAPEGPPLILTHNPCGKQLKAVMACSACGERVDPRDTSYELLPAATTRRGASKIRA